MRKNNSLKRKTFIASLMVCLVSALALTAGVMYNRKGADRENNLADLNETTAEYATADEVREIAENSTSKKTQEDSEYGDSDRDTYSFQAQGDEYVAMQETTTAQENVTEQEQETAVPEAQVANAGASMIHFDEAASLAWPVTGEVILDYSMDKTIYFPTLDTYKCNSGMMIQADAGTPVCAAGAGVVEDVSVSREFGNVLTVDMGDGYKAEYGQLAGIIPQKGEMIEKGQQIGTLAEPTAYYTVEGYNLYFKLTKDGNPVDPLDYIKE